MIRCIPARSVSMRLRLCWSCLSNRNGTGLQKPSKSPCEAERIPCFTLPDDKDTPTREPQGSKITLVTFLISIDLCPPVPGICRRLCASPSAGMPVPEAPVNQYYSLARGHHNVRLAG